MIARGFNHYFAWHLGLAWQIRQSKKEGWVLLSRNPPGDLRALTSQVSLKSFRQDTIERVKDQRIQIVFLPTQSHDKLTVSPSPVPPDWLISPISTCRNGSNMTSIWLSRIPFPVSDTRDSAMLESGVFDTSSVTSPLLVNLIAPFQ